jgi:predicted DNA-binding transcriptional regulator YafY
MGRATKADTVRLLNAAYHLLQRSMALTEAAERLSDEWSISRRQAYRYLEQASALSEPVPVVEPTVAVTLKLPASTVRALHVHARRSGLTLGQIVTQALVGFLDAIRRHG